MYTYISIVHAGNFFWTEGVGVATGGGGGGGMVMISRGAVC